MRRAGYEAEESDWIDALCCAMNRWAMASSKVEAEGRLWALPSEGVMAAVALASPAEHSYQTVDPDIPHAMVERQRSMSNLREQTRYAAGHGQL
ncbi:MAG TPA: hypothetical protein VMF64_03240 [Steroidobacteraceae bacterium]|nr:hypothetical protein [Steroidobacteraceae bacterium]